MSDVERQVFLEYIEYQNENPWMKYQGDPVRFVEEGLQEVIWGKQREILESLIVNQRTAVPAAHAPGKTHIAARAVAYWAACYPPGTTKVITTSSTFRQVQNVLWPHIRRLHMHHMPELGYTNKVEWMMGNPPEAVVEGFKPPDDDEAATQGTHAPNLLIVVDEAGGIKAGFGRNLEALMTGGNTRMLILGNPPVDEEQTWFERLCNSDRYHVIRIGWEDTPNFTGEATGNCKSCPKGVPPHEVKTHLIDAKWVQGIIDEFGKDSAYYTARVDAQFPRDNSSKTLPMGWLERSVANVLEGTDTQRIKLGVDIASDGGDEFVIARLDGWRARIVHAKAGADNEDAVKVAGRIAQEIDVAEADHAARGITLPVRVKLDAIGVGWGVVSMLQQWQRERRFSAEIVGVNVAERARESTKFTNQRAEMWWATRKLIQPGHEDALDLWLDIDTKELAQLNGPTYAVDSSGRIQIEKKADMKKRGISSPDRAEAILLAVFEPPGTPLPLPPEGIGQQNRWSSLLL